MGLTKTLIKLLITLSLVSFAMGCAESENDSFGSQFQVLSPADEKVIDVTDTLPEIEPETIPQASIAILRGSTELEKTQALWNNKTGTVSLRGSLKVKSRNIPTVPFEFNGEIQSGQDFILKVSEETKRTLPRDLELGARAFCLKSGTGPCESLIVDFFLKKGSEVFVHQAQIILVNVVEAAPVTPEAPPATPAVPATPSVPTVPARPVIPQPPLSEKEDEPAHHEEEEEEDGHGHESDEQVGTFNTPLSEQAIQETLDQSQGKKEPKPLTPESDKKPKAQIYGAPNEGQLLAPQNFAELKSKDILLLRAERKRYFATSELVQVLNWMGEYSFSLAKQKLVVGDLSAEKGGKIGSHLSHQTGLDADLAYMIRFGTHFNSVVLGSRLVDGFLIYQQWELFKQTVKLGAIDRIFVHKVVKQALCRIAIKKGELTKETQSGLAFETLRRLRSDTVHNTHYHLRLKCPKNEVMCRQMVEPPKTSGCF